MYPVPASLKGYQTSWLTSRASRYKQYNGFVSGGIAYVPGSPTSGEIITITFIAVPDDGSIMAVPDGVGASAGIPTKNFNYDYAGAPGFQVIPLVAGGGTTAQAATATQVSLAQYLDNWTVTNPSAGVVRMQRNQVGFNLTAAELAAMTADLINTPIEGSAVTVGVTESSFGTIIPGRFGRNYCILPA